MAKLRCVIFFALMILLCTGFSSRANANILFSEDWESGTIDYSIWEPYGTPSSTVEPAGYNSQYAIDPQGDSWCFSGLNSRQSFAIKNTTLSFDAKQEYSGAYFHNVQIGFGSEKITSGNCPEGGYYFL